MPRRLVLTLIALGLTMAMSAAPVAAAGVVGDGTPGSCTETALTTALGGGGAVTFNCGPAPVTITFTSTKTITTATSIDGGGLVTFSGGDAVRFFSVDGVAFELSGLVLRDGRAGAYGGAIHGDEASITIADSTFLDNSVTSYGGAISMFAHDGDASLTISGSTFVGNSATGYGGTIHVWPDSSTGPLACGPQPRTVNLTIFNSTFSGNSSGQQGSVILLDTASAAPCPDVAAATVRFSTFVANGGGNVFGTVGFSTNATNLGASLVANNVAASCASGAVSSGYNVTDETCFTPTTGDQQVADAMVGSLAANGGPTDTVALMPGSAAIGAVDAGTLGCGTTVTADQRAVTRPQGTDCDAGAFELAVAAPPPTPVASTLPNAALADPAIGSPLLALAFAALLIGALATLAAVNVEGVLRRRE